MKLLPKIVFLLIWFINLINPTPAFSTPESPNKSNLTESTTASSFTHPELETSPEDREFLGCYERVSRAYFLLSAGKIGFGVFKNSVNLMKSSWTKFKTSNFFANYKTLNPTNATKLESEVKNVIEEADKLDGVVVQGAGRHPNWVEITDIASKIDARMPHVDYLDFKGNGFEGCHTQNAMNQYLANNPGWTGGFVDANGNAISLLDNVPIEAYPWVKDVNGNLFTKVNGAGQPTRFFMKHRTKIRTPSKKVLSSFSIRETNLQNPSRNPPKTRATSKSF